MSFSEVIFLNHLLHHRLLIPQWFLSVFRLFSGWLLSYCSLIVPVLPPLALSPSCPTTLKSLAGPSFPNVSGGPIGRISVPVIPASLLGILRHVGRLDSSQINRFRGGETEPPVPIQADSWLSPRRLPELTFLCELPTCIPLESLWRYEAAARGCGHGRG